MHRFPLPRTLATALALALLPVLPACGGGGDPGGGPPASVASVTLTAPAAEVVAGQTLQLSATPTDAAGNPLPGRAVSWSTSNPAVATVSGTGLVSALQAGPFVVSATSEGRTGQLSLVVRPVPVASVRVAPDTATLVAGSARQLAAATLDAQGNTLPGRAVAWSTSSGAIATVDGTGRVVAVAPGIATIRATSEGRQGSATVTVVPAPVATVAVTPDTATLIIGAVRQLAAALRDSAGAPLGGRAVAWASDDPAVASVSGAGLVSAVGTGTARITATSEGRQGSATVTVIPVPVATVTVAPDTATLAMGTTRQLTAGARSATGAQLTGRAVSWSSDDATVATVSATGLVSAVGEGTARITATSEGRSGSARIVVERATPVSGIVARGTRWTLAGSPYVLTGTVQVAFGDTLVVEPGVVVRGGGRRLEVYGALRAVGTEAARITFQDTKILGTGRVPEEPHRIDVAYARIDGGSFYAPTGGAYGSFSLRASVLTGLESFTYVWYPVADCLVEGNVFVRSGGISVGTSAVSRGRVYIRNNAFSEWTDGGGTTFAVQNWASYGREGTFVEHNSFLSTDRVAVRLPKGYDSALLNAPNNYWGTTDEAVIAAMIQDRTDDAGLAGVIEFRPFLAAPHPATPSPGPAPLSTRRPRR